MREAEPSEESSRSAIRVLITDASNLNCQLIENGLRGGRQKLAIVAATADTTIALAVIKEQRPDVTIVRERLTSGATDGFAFVRNIHQMKLETRVIMLLDRRERDAVIDAFGYGAHGVVFRDEALKVLTKAIRAVYGGQFWVNSLNLGFVMNEFARLMPLAANDTRGAKLLTKRQKDIVRLLNQGLSNRDIAAQAGLSEATVRNYLQHVFDRLGVSSRVELLTNYRNLGQSAPEDDLGTGKE
jgi:DNA-binding NarL/FixJ family response regulator